jgi:hypothetical protein
MPRRSWRAPVLVVSKFEVFTFLTKEQLGIWFLVNSGYLERG